MSWLTLAAGLLRDAMSSSSEPPPAVQDAPPPADISGVMRILNQHRSEIDKNFEAVAGMLNALNERHLKAIQIQRRWNYDLIAALGRGSGGFYSSLLLQVCMPTEWVKKESWANPASTRARALRTVLRQFIASRPRFSNQDPITPIILTIRS